MVCSSGANRKISRVAAALAVFILSFSAFLFAAPAAHAKDDVDMPLTTSSSGSVLTTQATPTPKKISNLTVYCLPSSDLRLSWQSKKVSGLTSYTYTVRYSKRDVGYELETIDFPSNTETVTTSQTSIVIPQLRSSSGRDINNTMVAIRVNALYQGKTVHSKWATYSMGPCYRAGTLDRVVCYDSFPEYGGNYEDYIRGETPGSLKLARVGSGEVRVSWKKPVTSVYEGWTFHGTSIRYSYDKSMKNAVERDYWSSSTEYTLANLKRGKRVYVQVRAFASMGSIPQPYGRWSAVKSIRLPPAVGDWTRLAGDTRLGTMAEIVEQGFKSSDWAIVTTAWNYPDALGAAALASAYGCPIITTDVGSLSSEAAAQLTRLKVKNVIVLGGTSAVSANTVKQIKGVSSVKYVKRLAGATRYETSLAAYKQFKAKRANGYDTVIIVTGGSFADALSVSPYAYAKRAPMLLAKPKAGLTADMVKAVKADKNVKKVLVVTTGDAVSVSKVKSQLPGKTVTVIKGSSVYGTNKAVVNFELRNGMSAVRPLVATGKNYADALAGGPLAGKTNSVLVLAKSADSAGVSALVNHKASIKYGYVLGGPVAVPDAVCQSIAAKTSMKFIK